MQSMSDGQHVNINKIRRRRSNSSSNKNNNMYNNCNSTKVVDKSDEVFRDFGHSDSFHHLSRLSDNVKDPAVARIADGYSGFSLIERLSSQ